MSKLCFTKYTAFEFLQSEAERHSVEIKKAKKDYEKKDAKLTKRETLLERRLDRMVKLGDLRDRAASLPPVLAQMAKGGVHIAATGGRMRGVVESQRFKHTRKSAQAAKAKLDDLRGYPTTSLSEGYQDFQNRHRP